MKKFSLMAFVSFLMSLFGPLTLVFLYAQALLRPEEHAAFIFRAGMAIYIIEFLSIHSSGMLSADHKSKKKRWFSRFALLGFYAIFTIGFMIGLDCLFIGLYFLLSLCAKLFISQSIKDDISRSQIAFSVINLIGCTFAVILLAPLLKKVFPVPHSVISQKSEGTSGLFVNTPQTLLAWGVLYFTFIIGFNSVMFYKSRRMTGNAEITS
jgi:hypothetical protein